MNKDIDELTLLNRDYVASVQNSDVKRFDEILAQDFYCTNPDKTLVDRAAFLKQTAIPVKIKNLMAEDVKIRVLGDFAIIHAATSYTTPDGEQAFWALHRLLGPAERPLACGIGACGAVSATSSFRGSAAALNPESCAAYLRDSGFDAYRAPRNDDHASNMITLRTVLPAFIAAKPSLISESLSLAEIQSSRCSLPRM